VRGIVLDSYGLGVALLLAVGFQAPPGAREFSTETQEHLQQVAKTLPPDGALRRALSSGAHGDGIHYPWMDRMKLAGAKCVKVQLNLTWFFGPRFLKIARVMYFSEYDNPDSQIIDPQRIKSFQSSGLEEKLLEVALQRGAHGVWFESPPAQHPSRWGPVPAGIQIDLLDEEWLPSFPPFYWNRDTSQSPLVRAVAAGDRFETRKLLSEGHLDTTDLDCALHWAASGNDTGAVRQLLALGARVNAAAKSGWTPLMGAINNQRIANAKILIDAGADVNARIPENGDTALTLPLYYKGDSLEAVSLLLGKGANPSTTNSMGRSALMLATFGQPSSVVEALLHAGAKVNAQDRNGNTALMAAAEYKNIEAVKLLLRAHADRTLVNRAGQTALSIASHENQREVVQLLAGDSR
jgi:ankyrin repeat protein